MRMLLVTALLVLTACQAQRTLVVTSQPPGAFVRVDGVDYGTTPAEIPFLHYGTRRVSLNLEGYLSHSEVIKLRPPWYGYFPFDFFSEILFPVGWKDVHRVRAKLEEGQGTIPAPDLADVLIQADELRRAGPDGPQSERPPRDPAETPSVSAPVPDPAPELPPEPAPR